MAEYFTGRIPPPTHHNTNKQQQNGGFFFYFEHLNFPPQPPKMFGGGLGALVLSILFITVGILWSILPISSSL